MSWSLQDCECSGMMWLKSPVDVFGCRRHLFISICGKELHSDCLGFSRDMQQPRPSPSNLWDISVGYDSGKVESLGTNHDQVKLQGVRQGPMLGRTVELLELGLCRTLLSQIKQ